MTEQLPAAAAGFGFLCHAADRNKDGWHWASHALGYCTRCNMPVKATTTDLGEYRWKSTVSELIIEEEPI